MTTLGEPGTTDRITAGLREQLHLLTLQNMGRSGRVQASGWAQIGFVGLGWVQPRHLKTGANRVWATNVEQGGGKKVHVSVKSMRLNKEASHATYVSGRTI